MSVAFFNDDAGKDCSWMIWVKVQVLKEVVGFLKGLYVEELLRIKEVTFENGDVKVVNWSVLRFDREPDVGVYSIDKKSKFF